MTGTFVNVAGIILGSLIGLLIRKGIPEHINEAIMKIQGVVICIIGLNGVIGSMFTVSPEGKLSDSGGLLLLVSCVLGCLVGELLAFDKHLNSFGMWVEKKINLGGFSRGFVTASLIYSLGAMSVIGPINDGLTGDTSVLYIKTMLDGTTSIVLAASLGAGVLFACVPVFIVQAIPALLARQLAPFISDELLALFCMVGYTIVICIGYNFLSENKIKTANILPALVVPVVYYFVFM
jgi:uncharacterized membrane protein YqgA involved in biofilm formation